MDAIALMRVGWLTLAFMMLLSRVLFQAAGPVSMRAFLDAWQDGPVKRVWGTVSLAYAALVVVALLDGEDPRALEWVLIALLLAVLAGDGLLNVAPAGFRTFKDSVQDAWVRRRRGSGGEGDAHLFATVNALLAVAAGTMAAVVIAYEPIAVGSVLLAGAVAVVLTVGLVAATRRLRPDPRGGRPGRPEPAPDNRRSARHRR